MATNPRHFRPIIRRNRPAVSYGFAVLLVGVGASLASPTLRAEEAAEKAEQVRVFGKATLEVPAAFGRKPLASRIVEHEFEARHGEGDEAQTARITLMPSGGSIRMNLERWQKQFAGDPQAFRTEKHEIDGWQVVIAEHRGTYSDQMGGGPFAPGRTVERPDYAMIAAILDAPVADGDAADSDLRRKYFVKMVGPDSVVKANRDAFVKMIKSLSES